MRGVGAARLLSDVAATKVAESLAGRVQARSDNPNVPCSQLRACLEEPRNKWHKVLEPVRAPGENGHSKTEALEILLVLKILVSRHEDVVVLLSGTE
jgi:hypothetical protein